MACRSEVGSGDRDDSRAPEIVLASRTTKHDAFIGQLQSRAHLASRGEAEVATRAVLETLAGRITADEASDAASQLPRGIAEYLQTHLTGMRFPLDEFFERVREREGTQLPEAVYHARVVIQGTMRVDS